MSHTPVNESFHYCPQCGEGSSGCPRSSDERFVCPACSFCLYFNPAGAVAAIIQDTQGRILFIRRKKDPAKGKLSLPGGFINSGESVEDALSRETREEVNLEIVSANFICSAPNNYNYRGITYPVTDLFFSASVRTFDSISPQETEVTAIEFLPPSEKTMEQLAFPSLKHALIQFNYQT